MPSVPPPPDGPKRPVERDADELLAAELIAARLRSMADGWMKEQWRDKLWADFYQSRQSSPKTKGKRGAKPDAVRWKTIRTIVRSISPSINLDTNEGVLEVAGAIDRWNKEHGEREILIRKSWQKNGVENWEDAELREVRKYIKYALKQAGND